MPETICDTSPIQYLYQLRLLHILPALVQSVIVPPAVISELATGRSLGVSLPKLENFDWVKVRQPVGSSALPLVTDLGPGETEALMLALESRDAVVILDDALARRTAELLGLGLTGTLGLLLDAKSRGLVSEVAPLLKRLQALRFRIASHTLNAVLKLAGEI